MNHEETKIEFVNEPQRLSIEHLGDTYSGYRVCLSLNEKKMAIIEAGGIIFL